MASGIKDKVVILGMGCSKFGERWDAGVDDLMLESFLECIKDAGIEKKDIDACWYGLYFDEISAGKSGITVSQALKLPFIPVTRVENKCATGTEAFRGACYGVASGAYDICLAIGVEKLKDTGFGGLPGGATDGQMEVLTGADRTAPGAFAQLGSAYEAAYGIPMKRIKEAMAHISWKSHQNGFKNPRAHLRNTPTIDKILNAPMVAYPSGLFDCCGVSDGSAAAVITTPEIAKKIKKNQELIYVKSIQVSCSSGEEGMYTDWNGANVMTTTKAAAKAYEEAGIKNPRQELSMMEVHDCFSITELVTMEDLQISSRGGAVDDILNGFYDLDGNVPCQTDGGLKCFGHPIGASGIRMLYEMYHQLLGTWSEDRLVKNPRFGLTHNLGGFPNRNVVSVSIIGKK